MFKVGSKILVSIALCLGIVMPTAQAVSHTTKVVVGASGLFAVHVAYEVNAAYKRACKARKKKILAARRKQQHKHTAPQEKELKPMTWNEFRSTTKYLKKHLNTKNLLASGILLGAGGYFTTKNSKKISLDTSTPQRSSSDPKPNTTNPLQPPHTEPKAQPEKTKTSPAGPLLPTESPKATEAAASTPVQPIFPQKLKKNKRIAPSVEASTSQPIHASSATSKAPTLHQVIKTLSKERPKNAVAQDMVTNFIQGKFQGEELQRQIVNLQAGLGRELFRYWITRDDLRLFSSQLSTASSLYANILDHLLFLTDDRCKHLYQGVLSSHVWGIPYFESCLFEKRSDDSCILCIHYKGGLFKYISIKTHTEYGRFLGFKWVSRVIDGREARAHDYAFPETPAERSKYYQSNDMHDFVTSDISDDRNIIDFPNVTHYSLLKTRNQQILNAAVDILSQAGIKIILPTELDVSQRPYYLSMQTGFDRWAKMTEHERNKAFLDAQTSPIRSALIKELVEERMSLEDIKPFITLCRENRAYENNIFESLYYHPPTEEYLKMFRKKIAPGTWDEAAHGTIQSYYYDQRNFYITTSTGLATFYCDDQYQNRANTLRFEPHTN